jgi:hypothetical protein
VRLVHTHCPKIVFILETRQPSDRVRNIWGRKDLNNYFVVDCQCKGGGLALHWDDSIKLTILLYGLYHIDTLI